MAEFSRREITPRPRVEYVLRSPTNWAEISKVLTVVQDDLAHLRESDDMVTVEARDHEIVFWYEKEDRW